MRSSIHFILLLATVALIPGCGRGRGVATPPAAPPAAPIAPAALLYYDNGGGIQDSLRLTIRDEDMFREIWTQATSTQPSPPAMPNVDFRRSMLLVVSTGRMTPEDMVRVDSVGVHQEVSPNGNRQRVMQAIVRTIRGCGGFSSDAYPLAIVQVERFDGPVRFTERRERTEGCAGAGTDRLRRLLASVDTP
jgi:hypothetical protein